MNKQPTHFWSHKRRKELVRNLTDSPEREYVILSEGGSVSVLQRGSFTHLVIDDVQHEGACYSFPLLPDEAHELYAALEGQFGVK